MRTELSCGAILLAVCATLAPPVLAQTPCTTPPRTISVTGTAEIKVAPDGVKLTLAVDSHNRDLSVAKGDNDGRVKQLLALARKAGIEAKNIQTSALTMGPQYSDERIPKLLDYEVSQVVVITLTDLSKYEGLMTEALTAGVNRVDGISFFISEESKYREQARLEAVQAARDKAVAMASTLGQTVGKPWDISEEDNELNQLATVNTTAFITRMQMPYEGPTVAGGQVVVRASIRISFLLE